MKYRGFLLKRSIEDVFIFPFILIGRFIALLYPLRNEYRVFYFFPFYHTGGAEKIHALVAKATGDENCIIFFTRKSVNHTFYSAFKNTGCRLLDISKYTDNKWLYFLNLICRGVVSGYINKQNLRPVVFNGQCNFGYKISPWIKKEIRQIELIHSFNSFSVIRIPFLPFIDQTIMISKEKIAEHQAQYKKLHIPQIFANKIIHIPNTSEFDLINKNEKHFSSFIVLYSGRGTPEKRVHLVTEIAKKVHLADSSIQFQIMGDVSGAVNSTAYPEVKFMGNITDSDVLKKAYQESAVLLITSTTEGFPLSMIEAMAYGCAIIATPVGDIPDHLTDNENGYLFSTAENEAIIIEEGVNYILQLRNNSVLLKKISEQNINYAQEHFSYKKFAQAYNKIINQ